MPWFISFDLFTYDSTTTPHIYSMPAERHLNRLHYYTYIQYGKLTDDLCLPNLSVEIVCVKGACCVFLARKFFLLGLASYDPLQWCGNVDSVPPGVSPCDLISRETVMSPDSPTLCYESQEILPHEFQSPVIPFLNQPSFCQIIRKMVN